MGVDITIKVLVGDMFESEAQTLVNTVNCVGVMGAGIALEFKKRFPQYYQDYRARCELGKVKLGRPYLYRRLGPPWILSFPTKDHWRSMTKLEDIVNGLEWLVEHYGQWELESLAFPPLGTGHGQLEWRIVGPTLYRYLSQLSIPVELYAPYEVPLSETQIEFLQASQATALEYYSAPDPRWIKPGWIAVVEILKRINDQPYRNPVGHTIFQKIAYLATEEGLPTGLQFERGSYGPFAKDLRTAMTRLLNNGIIEENRMGRLYSLTVGPTYTDAKRAYARYIEGWRPTINRIADLFMRTKMDTDTAELVTTVIFAARRLKEIGVRRPTEKEVFKAVAEWKKRRRPPLDFGQLAYATRFLAGLGWIEVDPSPELQVPDMGIAAT